MEKPKIKTFEYDPFSTYQINQQKEKAINKEIE
jgi:hypothetical protein